MRKYIVELFFQFDEFRLRGSESKCKSACHACQSDTSSALRPILRLQALPPHCRIRCGGS
jgi:hypothetical protein